MEPSEATSPLSLDVVRARIFYLACDVEPVSPPAAMLLRAVADAIDEGTGARFGDVANSNGALASLFSHAAAVRATAREGGAERLLHAVSSRPERDG